MIRYLISVPPSGDVVTLAEAKAWIKKTANDEDTLIESLIAAATSKAIGVMSRAILTTTYEGYNDSFFDDWTLRKGEFQSVESLDVLVDGAYQVIDPTEYQVTIGGIFGEICRLDSQSHDLNCNAVRATFKVGFGDTAADVPDDIKTAIKLIFTNWYSNRGDCAADCSGGDGIPVPADCILKRYRVVSMAKFCHSLARC